MSWVGVGTAAVGVLGNVLAPKRASGTAPLQQVNLQTEQRKAIEGNQINESGIEALLARSNSFAQDQSLSLMEKAMPGYSKLAGRLTGLTNDLLTNPYELPPDVQKNIERQAAERGISVGGRGQFQDFSLLRDLGVNSLQYGQQRIGQAQSLTGLLASLAPKVNPMSPMSFYVTPGQTAQIAAGQNAANQEIAQSGLNAEAAAKNNRNQNLWDSLAFAAGAFGNGTSTGKKPAGTSTSPIGDFGLGYGGGAAGVA